jgi:hypothetical protein
MRTAAEAFSGLPARAGRARWLLCAALAWVLAGALTLPAAAQEKPPEKPSPTLIEKLRLQQQAELQKLKERYHALVRANPNLVKPDGSIDTSHPDYEATLKGYKKEKSDVQTKYKQQDPRAAELAALEAKYGKGNIDISGSAPKEVRADVDISAKTPALADKIAAEWKKAHGEENVVYNPELGIWIDKSTDTTLWAPPTPEQLENRKDYHDAFSTPGGKKATGVKSDEAVRDPEGFVLDNEKKFIHAAGDLNNGEDPGGDAAKQLARDMALKTAGKSVSKSAEATGQDSPVAKDADRLRNYEDEFETGITALGATPEQHKRDVQQWLGKADQQLQNSKDAAVPMGQKVRAIREEVAKTTERKPGQAPEPTGAAGRIRDRNERVEKENEKARAENDEARKHAGLPPAPPRDDEAVGTGPRAPKEPEAVTSKTPGSAANASWVKTQTTEGDKRTDSLTSTTIGPDGSVRKTDRTTVTDKTAGGGKTSQETSTKSEVGADGSTRQVTQTTSTYTGEGKAKPGADGDATAKKPGSGAGETDATSKKSDGGVGDGSGTAQKPGGGADGDSDGPAKTPAGGDGRKVTVTTTKSTEHETTPEKKGWLTNTPGSSETTTTQGTSRTETGQDGSQTGRTQTSTKSTKIGTDGTVTETQSTTIGTTRTGKDGEEGPGRTFTDETKTTTGKWGTTTTQAETTTETDGKGGKTTTTDTSTSGPLSSGRSKEWGYEKDLGEKKGEGDEKPADKRPVDTSVKIAGGNLFEDVNKADATTSTSGATTTAGGFEVEGEHKVEVGQKGAKGSWEVTAKDDGLHAKANVSGEYNAIKITTTGSAEKDLGGGKWEGKVTGTAKVGAEAKGQIEGVLSTQKVAVSAEAEVFVGGKAEIEAETSLSALGLKVTGRGQAEVSYGAGGKAGLDAELSWTKIKLGGKLAGTLGLGTGGSASVELDATVLITGVDLDDVGRQQAAAEGIIKICRDLRDGRLTLPPGTTFADIRKALQDQAAGLAKHPQKDGKGKPIDLADSLAKALKLGQGKGGGSFVTAKHSQKDWYCTNRPQIEAPVQLPPIVQRK